MTDKKTKVQKFRYESIIKSAWFKRVDRDLLTILLDKEKEYTFNEVQDILKKEKERVVN